MKKLYIIAVLLSAATAINATNTANLSAQRSELRFTENAGQVADLQGNPRPDILFTAHSRGVKLFVSHTGIHYQFTRTFEKTTEKSDKALTAKFEHAEIDSTQFYRMDMQLVGANANATIIKEGEGSDYENYYLAHCPNGILGVKNYTRITYQNIYPNIDWVIYSKGYYMEYDFVVKPGGNPADIKIKYDGAANLYTDAEGKLHATTPLGKITETAPFTYQGIKQPIKSSFLLQGDILAFAVGNYNTNENLTIDPVGEW